MRQLILAREEIHEALETIKAKHSALANRITAGESLNKEELAQLEQAEVGKQVLEAELEKTTSLLNKLVEQRQRYVNLLQEYESLLSGLKIAEQQRAAAIVE